MDLRVNQEIPCSIRECHQKDQRGVCSFCFTFNSQSVSRSPLHSLCVIVALLPCLPLSPSSSPSLFRNTTTVGFSRCMIYSLLCFLLLLECLVERTGNFEPEYKAMYIWVTHFSHFFWEPCVCALPLPLPLSSERLSGDWVDSSSLRHVRPWSENQWGAPIQGEAGGKGKEGGRRRTGQRGWELNNGWFLIEIKAWW